MPEYLRVLPDEKGYKLEGFVDRRSYGIFHYCYSQPSTFVNSVLEEDIPKGYPDSRNRRVGQETVELLCSILESIPEFEVVQTNPKSVADCCLRWDVILRWNNHAFPIQVKTRLKDIEEAVSSDLISNYASERVDSLQ
jgi:hypothetical protein